MDKSISLRKKGQIIFIKGQNMFMKKDKTQQLKILILKTCIWVKSGQVTQVKALESSTVKLKTTLTCFLINFLLT